LRKEREFDCVRRIREHDEKGIPRGFDLLTLAELAEDFPNRGMMLLDRQDRLLVSKLLLKLSRADNIREYESQDSHPMAALELLNFSAAFERDLL